MFIIKRTIKQLKGNDIYDFYTEIKDKSQSNWTHDKSKATKIPSSFLACLIATRLNQVYILTIENI
jgi:hypothetical protein